MRTPTTGTARSSPTRPAGRCSSSTPATAPRPTSRTPSRNWKACGGANLPSKDWGRNSAWLQLNALAVTLTAWLRHIALDGELAKAAPKKLRFRLFAAPAR